jgi:hypothetical protein
MGSTYGNISPSSINDVASTAQRLADSYASIPPISNAAVDLIGHNTIAIRDQFRVSAAYQLRCVVENEKNLNNINPRSFLTFSELVLYAIQSYIYKELIITMDQGYLQGGQELGAFKEYVSAFSDSEANYMTCLKEKWMKVAFLNDVNASIRLMKLMIAPGL